MQVPRGRRLILDLDTSGGEWSVSRPGRALPLEMDHGIHWIGGWQGVRAGLATEARLVLFLCRG
jgi:hypothetical protein